MAPASTLCRAALAGAPVSSSAAPAKGPHLNARIFGSLARYLRENVGIEALDEALATAGLEASTLDGRSHWITLAQGESLLGVARRHCNDDDAFRRACGYRLADGYGALRFVLWAVSPEAVYRQAVKTQHLVCTYGSSEVVDSDRTTSHIRYRATQPESRLMCLSRQAAIEALPTLWGLPPAYVREDSCIARGDPYCSYHLRWYDKRRWYPIALGIVLGGVLFAALSAVTHGADVSGIALPMLGAAIGYILENQRTSAANRAVNEEVTDALRELAREESEARQELLELHQRQRDWTRMLEEDAAERSAQLQRVADRLSRLQEVRDTKILGFSHDLRNPLTVLQAGTEYLRDYVDLLGEEGDAVLGDVERAIEQMRRLLEDLMTMATQQATLAQLAPQRLEVAPLTDRLRRRLRALVQGKDIRATVFKTREAPDGIETDPLLFDRVIDNLLTNAAKYTERGSIVVEVDGTTEYLTLKVSDTGRGMPAEQIERAFTPEGSDRALRAQNSYGVGLSVVVQLLGQVGGRLEVMSKPASGTTFWVHFPLAPSRRSKPPSLESDRPIEKYKDVLSRVVTIRRNKAS
ncbi:MAG: HAMP domain-containing sensor histidine kinase [Polyangiales bacterium]